MLTRATHKRMRSFMKSGNLNYLVTYSELLVYTEPTQSQTNRTFCQERTNLVNRGQTKYIIEVEFEYKQHGRILLVSIGKGVFKYIFIWRVNIARLRCLTRFPQSTTGVIFLIVVANGYVLSTLICASIGPKSCFCFP